MVLAAFPACLLGGQCFLADRGWGSSGNRLWGKLKVHSERLTCVSVSCQEGEADHSGYAGEVGFRVSTMQCVSLCILMPGTVLTDAL